MAQVLVTIAGVAALYVAVCAVVLAVCAAGYSMGCYRRWKRGKP